MPLRKRQEVQTLPRYGCLAGKSGPMAIDNQEIAQVFDNMAAFLEMKGDSFFKIRAYQRAARTIENLDFSLEDAIRDEMDLAEIPGFGEAISSKTVELVTTGRMDAYEKLKAEMPEGVLDLTEIPGVGPKTAFTIANELGVSTLDELEHAIHDGRIHQVPKMGEKAAQNLLKHIERARAKGSGPE